MLDNYKDTQPIVYRILKNALINNKTSHAYLFETKGYPKQLDLALDFSKALICDKHYTNNEKCKNCYICKRIEEGNFSEVKIIEPDGQWIKKEQLKELQKEFSTKAIESKQKIYIINHAEKMNGQAANSILKFLEEPEENIIAILLVNNIYQMLDTIVSRCQIINLNKINSSELAIKYSDIDSTLFKVGTVLYSSDLELENYINNSNSIEQIKNIINFILFYEKNGKETLLYTNKLWHEFFKDKTDINNALEIMILFYKDVLNLLLNRKIDIMTSYLNEIEVVSKYETTAKVIDKINILINSKENIKINANNALLIDKMILSFEGGK